MKKVETICNYSLFDKLLDENSNSEALKHLLECPKCQNEIIKFDLGLISLKNSSVHKSSYYANENELSEFIENIKSKKISISADKPELINLAIEQIGLLKNYDIVEKNPTPEFLKQIVFNGISDKKNTTLEKIIIKVSDGLQIIGNYIENMYIMHDLDSMVPVRSKKSDKKNRQSTLNFFQKKGRNEIIRYNIVQDGPESILLTIKLENFESQPVSLSIRNKNQLIASQPFNNNYAYFHKLKTGDYQFEVNFSVTESAFVIPLCIV